MSLKAQAKILRVLQECTIQRVGANQNIEVDIRVIAATNKDLKQAIKEGSFRKDLFYRLNVIPFRIPSLRERREDIPELVQGFLQRYSKGRPKEVTVQAMKVLQSYLWPGNVRELKNWVERACILSSSDVIDSDWIEDSTGSVAEPVDWSLSSNEKSLRIARAAFEKNFIVQKLEENGGNIRKTAQVIGIERSHLHKKIKTYGIEDCGAQ